MAEPTHNDQPGPPTGRTPRASGPSLSVGTTVGNYVVRELIGRGGMGEVYKAFDPRLSRHVAIKVLASGVGDRPDFLRRFEREALAVSALTHKNICTVYDTGQHDGLPFIVMEFLEGDTLEAMLHDGPLALGRLLDIAIQIADALDAAHRQGFVHRDIKSANVVLTPRGDAKVLDFGIAKMKATTETALPAWEGDLTQPGIVVGTVAYVAPEQAAAAEVDARADIYSFGVLLFQMATGFLPYRGPPEQILRFLISGAPAPRVTSVNPALPAEFDRIVGRALEKDRRDRYQTAAEILADLRALRRDLTSGERTSASGAHLASIFGRRWWRRPAVALPLAAALLAVAAGAPVLWHRLAGVAPIRDLAVLPCANAGLSASLLHQCAVVSENLIGSLSRIPGVVVKSLQVVQQYAAMPKGAMDAGKELGVDAVLTSAVSDGSPRLYVELTDVRSGAHLWGKHFELPASEGQGVHESIAREVADSLRPTLSPADRARLELYQTFQQAQAELDKRTGDGLDRAIGLYRTVLRRDSAFAEAWAGLAKAYSLLPYYSPDPPPDAYQKARQAADSALRLTETLADAHAALALVRRDYDRDWRGAEREFQRALQLSPASGTSHQWYAEMLTMQSRFDEAEAHIVQAEQVAPASITVRAVHGWILLCAGRIPRAESLLQYTVEMDPSHPLARYFLAETYAAQGRYRAAMQASEEAVQRSDSTSWFLAGLASSSALAGQRTRALAILERLRLLAAGGTAVSHYDFAVVLAALGRTDEAIGELSSAIADHDRLVIEMNVDPMLRPLRADPRFRALVRRVGLAAS